MWRSLILQALNAVNPSSDHAVSALCKGTSAKQNFSFCGSCIAAGRASCGCPVMSMETICAARSTVIAAGNSKHNIFRIDGVCAGHTVIITLRTNKIKAGLHSVPPSICNALQGIIVRNHCCFGYGACRNGSYSCSISCYCRHSGRRRHNRSESNAVVDHSRHSGRRRCHRRHVRVVRRVQASRAYGVLCRCHAGRCDRGQRGLRFLDCRHSGIMRPKLPAFCSLMYNVHTSNFERSKHI